MLVYKFKVLWWFVKTVAKFGLFVVIFTNKIAFVVEMAYGIVVSITQM